MFGLTDASSGCNNQEVTWTTWLVLHKALHQAEVASAVKCTTYGVPFACPWTVAVAAGVLHDTAQVPGWLAAVCTPPPRPAYQSHKGSEIVTDNPNCT